MSERERFSKKLTPQLVWKLYSKGRGYNDTIQLDDEVETNENFFIGKQWEGVQSNGLPTPVFNFLKKVTLFTIASVTTDNLKMQAQPLGNNGRKGELYPLTTIVNNEFDALMEHNSIGGLVREYMRNAAVDGDGCMYTYWDAEAETGQAARGAIRTEVVENTRVFFGNPCDRRVQTQPHIIIERREFLSQLRERAEALGVKQEIRPDSEVRQTGPVSHDDDNVTVLTLFYKDSETKTVWMYECTREVELQHKDTELKLYPITWLNWDYRQNCYHGQSLISGLIPNQIYINKIFAMTMISLMTTAYPKILYDKTRVSRWTNQVGAAIAVNGGDVQSVARIMDPAQISPQIAQFIQLAVEYTQTFLGATPAAMGEVRPDNTSAIICLQRASSIPQEITKQNLYASIEELGRIYLDFMANYYGTRIVETTVPKDAPPMAAQFAGVIPGQEVSQPFDFSVLKAVPMSLKLDVGASAYWSEIASMQTLDNLLMQGKIALDDYLERIPDGYISKRQELLEKLRSQTGMQQPGAMAAPGGELLDSGQPTPVQGGGGDGRLQREIRQAI